MEGKHRIILRDNIMGITKPLIRRFADKATLLDCYKLSGLIYEEFRAWLNSFLKDILKKTYENRNVAIYLIPEDINLNIKYSYGPAKYYENMIAFLPFKRLIVENIQNVTGKAANEIKLSQDGLLLMIHYLVENSIDLFIKIKKYMDDQGKCKVVMPKHMQYVLKGNNLDII